MLLVGFTINIMEISVITRQELDELNKKIDSISTTLLQMKNSHQVYEEWVDSNTAGKVLNVTTRTIQNYRDNRLIPWSKIGGKILFRMCDLQNFLMHNRYDSNTYNQILNHNR